jgi:hypothetical protein
MVAKMKTISGGQTGADLTALDFPLGHGFERGGWCARADRERRNNSGETIVFKKCSARNTRRERRQANHLPQRSEDSRASSDDLAAPETTSSLGPRR